MEVLVRLRTAGRQIDFGVATTAAECAAILAQRFRVYQRRGYYRPGLTADRDEYDEKSVYILAMLRGGERADVMVGSARMVQGEAGFRYPAQVAMQFELPDAIRAIPVRECIEVGRVVSERPEGIVLGGVVTPLGLIQAVSEYSQRRGLRCGMAILKRRFLRVLLAAGVCLREIAPATVIYPRDGVAASYFYRHAEPVVPVYWLCDEIVPSIERAIARYVDAQSAALPQPTESTRNDHESATAR